MYTRKISILFLSVFAFLAIAVPHHTAYAATSSAILHITPGNGSYAAGTTLKVAITLDSPISAASVVKVVLNTTNLTYVSSDFTSSIFGQTVTAPSQNGSTITFALARFDTGYTGTGGLVGNLVFTVQSGTPTITIDQTNSQVVAYADSSQILASVTNGSYTVSTSKQSSLAQTGTDVLLYVAIAAALTAALFALSKLRPQKK